MLSTELTLVNTDAGAQRDPAYLKLNPNAKVPTLVVDGKFVMFRSAAMAMFIADRHPQAKLAPGPDEMARGHFYQWLIHLTNSVQPAMLRYYYPERHTADEGGHEAVTAKAMEEIASLWGRIDQHLASPDRICWANASRRGHLRPHAVRLAAMLPEHLRAFPAPEAPGRPGGGAARRHSR